MTDRPTTKSDFIELKRALQAFQAARMDRTYSDLKNHPEYRKIGRFFFEQLYGPKDFAFRDSGIRKLHRMLRGRIHKGILATVEQVLELHELSEGIDDRMVEKMIERGLGPDFGTDGYMAVYRSLENYEERMYQIDLAAETVTEFHRLSKKWLIGASLQTARTAAHLAGLGRIMDFVHEGYVSLKEIRNIDDFVGTVRERERSFNDAIWNGTPPG
jgi:hypothetical protein